ncbi:hypothetical protein HYV10_00780 [Candidatus Dependentiae bacterium]|nr:hypothetical protein [Candidatus Dependentiae bacterium]
MQDGILINFYQASGRYNVITFTEDIDNFRSNRARELRLFLLERQAVSACLVKEGSFLLSIDKPKEVSLLAALEYYDDLIQRRKEEEKLSFVEFLRLYAGKGDRLSADIQETKARVS